MTSTSNLSPTHELLFEFEVYNIRCWFRKNISKLIMGGTVHDIDKSQLVRSRFDVFPEMMVFKRNMFRSWGELGLFAIAMHDWLSLWTLMTNFGSGICKEKITFISFIKLFNGIVSLRAWDRAIYSASAVDKAISVWSLLCQNTGHPAYLMVNPVREYMVSASNAFSGSHPPAKLASTKVSIPLDSSGEYTNP